MYSINNKKYKSIMGKDKLVPNAIINSFAEEKRRGSQLFYKKDREKT